MTISCPLCGSERTRVVGEPRQVEADDGTSLAYTDELTECSKCGERFYTHEQAMASSRVRAAALRTHEHLLTPAQIRGIRRRFDLSQADLEALLGVGAKTVVRWERGTVCQGRAVDTLLRFLECFGPGAFDCVRGERVGLGAPIVFPDDLALALVSTGELATASRASGAWNDLQAYVTSSEHDLVESPTASRGVGAVEFAA